MNQQVLFSTQSDLWETPKPFFDRLNDEFHFELDVCANPQNAKCSRFYTLLDDGLSMPWKGVVWCNPPYGRSVGKWVSKAADSALCDGATVVMLLPARTDTQWFHKFILGKAEIRFVKGRLRFGKSKCNAPFPSMVAVFRPMPCAPQGCQSITAPKGASA